MNYIYMNTNYIIDYKLSVKLRNAVRSRIDKRE